MKLLILGGTGDAKQLAITLHKGGIDVIYSIAGIVRQPDLPCTVISGGFTKHGGLTRYLQDNKISAMLNATHPFAKKMSLAAQHSADQTGVLFWRYQRKHWEPTADDHWIFFDDWTQLTQHLRPFKHIFLSQGQLTETMLAALHQYRQPSQYFLHRTAVIPAHLTPEWMLWEHGIGPFHLDNERALLQHYGIQAIVSKHSGGPLPSKILAARTLKLPVLLLAQPTSPSVNHDISNLSTLAEMILGTAHANKTMTKSLRGRSNSQVILY